MSKDDSRLSGQGKLMLILGMQFGSEGKGAITSYLAPVMSLGVRTGAANAGHTVYFRRKKFVMRQVPSAWVNPVAKLVIGAGAMVSLPLLLEEIALIEAYMPIRQRLFVDRNAHVIQDEHIQRELESDLAMRIGSCSAATHEGIGTATAAKVLREKSCVHARDVASLRPYCADTVDMINDELDHGQYIQVEGTQGFGLSLEHGYFPYVTSRDTSASALAASIGVNASAFNTETIGVVRTYPIRVAGNSGNFDADSTELTWKEVTRRAGAKRPIIERTSVTKKVRRVATFSFDGFRRACQVNRPTELAVTFTDYLDWSVHEKQKTTAPVGEFISRLETIAAAPVTLLKTGPRTMIDFSWYRRSMLRKLAV